MVDVRLIFSAALVIICSVVSVRRGSAEEASKTPTKPPIAIGLDSKYQGTDYIFLANASVLPNGRWFVAALGRKDSPAELVRGDVRITPGGWFAVNLSTGDARHLLPPPDRKSPLDVEMGRCGFSDMIMPWDVDSCAVVVYLASKERLSKPTSQSQINKEPFYSLYPSDERYFLWRWNPETDKIEPLGWETNNWRLARGLQRTSYRIKSWEPPLERKPPDYCQSWSGRVLLNHKDTGQELPFLSLERYSRTEEIISRFAENERQQGRDFTIPDNSNTWNFHCEYFQDFGPTEQKDSLVEVHGCGTAYNAAYIQRIAIKPGFPVDWRIEQKDIERRLGESLFEVHLIQGASHPCRYLPLLLLTKSQKGQKRPLWMLDTKTGSLDGPFGIPWDFANITVNVSAYMFTDAKARFLAYQPQRRFVNFVYDLKTKRTIASLDNWKRDGRYLPVVGFDSKGNIVLVDYDRSEVFLWSPTFKEGNMTRIYGREKPGQE